MNRLILSILALVFASLIMGVSLINVTRNVAQANSHDFSIKEVYFGEEILPDHVAYPALMMQDRINLESASPLEKIYLRTAYANRRLYYTKKLIDKEKFTLAHSTLTKANKYLLIAGEEAMGEEVPRSTQELVLKTIIYHQVKSAEYKQYFTDDQKVWIDRFLDQSETLEQKLQAQLD